jgi:hypothetical protein
LKKSQNGLKIIAFSFPNPRQSSCQPGFDWWKNGGLQQWLLLNPAVTWEADQAMRILLGNYQESAAIALDVAAPALRATLQRRAKMAEAWTLNLVARSIAQLENREGPFSRDFTDAYASLRAIALTDKTLEDADIGILFVDIHT